MTIRSIGLRGAFVVNKYYTDNGIEYVASRLSAELGKRGHTLEFTPCPTLIYDENCSFDFGGGIDYVIFWNKDYMLARALEKAGIKVFNNSRAIEICDDKAKTYLQLSGSGVKVPRTVVAPVVYDVSEGTDSSFIARVENYLGYPVVVKENTGSQGRQVYLAQTRAELISLHASLLRTPHIFQRYEADERGVDIRVYVVGGKAVACCKRRNTTGFKSNVHMGGRVEKYEASDALKTEAERIASVIGLDYGSVDFLTGETHVFAEANSNAYMFGIEQLGYDIAGPFAEHIVRTVEGRN